MKKNIYKNTAIGFCLLLAGSANAQTIATIAGPGSSGTSGDGGPATAAALNYPSSVTRAVGGNVYAIESYYIRKIDPSGTISTIAGDGNYGFAGDGGPATASSFRISDGFSDIVVDGTGNIYFTDVSNNRIRKINTAGTISTIAGTGSATYGGDDGPATAADLYRPRGLALHEASNNMFVADFGNHVVRKINLTTGIITTVAGTSSTPGYSGDGGAATAALLNVPISVAVDATGNLYIAEYGNHTIRKVDAATGNISTIAGDGTIGSSGDGGAATAALLSSPTNVAVDPAGNIFITDYSNRAIRKIGTSGIITTVVGTITTAGFTGDGGAATAATLREPTDIFLSGNGDMYVADAGNGRVRLVTAAAIALSGTASSCVAGTNTLVAATAGGAWTSGTPAVATVSSGGVVTAVSAGTTTISYGMGLGFGSSVYTVSPTPAPVVSYSGGTLSVTGSFATYQWQLGGVAVPGATSATLAPAAGGSYAVIVTSTDGCTGTSAAFAVSSVSVYNTVSAAASAHVYPNPATDAVTIAGLTTGSRVAVVDLAGRVVYEHTASTEKMNISTLGLATGVYIVKVIRDGQTDILKLVINK